MIPGLAKLTMSNIENIIGPFYYIEVNQLLWIGRAHKNYSPQLKHLVNQSEQPKNHTTDAPVTDSVSASASSNDSKKISRQDIDLVRQSIVCKPF